MSITISGTYGLINMPSTAAPAFSAYPSVTVSISGSVWTKVQLNTVEFDTNSNFNTTTYRFTPTVAGYYQINASATIDGASANPTAVYNAIYKNGSAYKYFYTSLGGAGTLQGTATASAVVYLNGSTDYVEFYVQAVNGTGNRYSGGRLYTSMNGCLVRAA